VHSKAKSRDKSRVIRENQIDLPGFSVFELFDQLAEYYSSLLAISGDEKKRIAKRGYPQEPDDYTFALSLRNGEWEI